MQEEKTFALSKIRWRGALPWLVVWLGMVALGFGIVSWMFGMPAPRLQESIIGARGPIELVFAQAVDETSLAGRIEIRPEVAGKWEVQGSRVLFWPEQAFQAEENYQIRVDPGIKDVEGRVFRRSAEWQLTIRPLQVVFIGEVSRQPEVWVANTDGSGLRALTETGGTVYDFSVSPDGNRVAYSTENSNGGYDLWVVDRSGENPQKIVDCGSDWCVQPAWSRDGRLAYVRKLPGPSAGWTTAQIWVLEATGGRPEPLFDDDLPGILPSWSPDGRRLAYYDPDVRGVRVLDLADGENLLLPTEIESSGAWSNDRSQLAFLETDPTSILPLPVAFAVDFDSGEIRRLLTEADDRYEYGLPVFSPDGDRVLVGVRPKEGRPGVQLWTLAPDGTDGLPITNDVTFTHAHYHWSPAGDAVLYQRFLLGTSNSTPEVMIWRADNGDSVRLAEDASQPDWLP